jgi:hypothetical protein
MRCAVILAAALGLLGACSGIPGYEPVPKFLATPALPAGVYPTPAPIYATPPANAPVTTPPRRQE